MTARLAVALGIFLTVSAFAKRGAPPEVPPIHHAGVVYTTTPDEPDKMGVVEARDEKTGKKLWEKRIYNVFVNPLLEADVQWIFIKEMKLKEKTLLITNERGAQFVLDLETHQVQRIFP